MTTPDHIESDDTVLPRITGHVLIRDPETGQVILDKNDSEQLNRNAVHNRMNRDAEDQVS